MIKAGMGSGRSGMGRRGGEAERCGGALAVWRSYCGYADTTALMCSECVFAILFTCKLRIRSYSISSHISAEDIASALQVHHEMSFMQVCFWDTTGGHGRP